jgi:hypothetical protein
VIQSTLGIKRRGGQDGLEIKGFVAQGKLRLGLAGCECLVGLWAKWPTSALGLGDATLTRVQKRRWMRKFQISAGAVCECTRTGGQRASGCDAELTLIEVGCSSWWTFGFEAFGELERVENDLAATVAFLAGRHPPMLPPGEAGSYRSWLAALPGC